MRAADASLALLLLLASQMCLISVQAQGIIEKCEIFPKSSIWNVDISDLPVHVDSAKYVLSIGTRLPLRADFGREAWDGYVPGIPVTTVKGSLQPLVEIFQQSSEGQTHSDFGPFPIPPKTRVESEPLLDGHRRAIVVDTETCTSYELYRAFKVPNSNNWNVDVSAVFDLKSNQQRYPGRASASASGTSLLAGLLRKADVDADGEINHALRFTSPNIRRDYVWPATRSIDVSSNPQYPPMGQRFRLKADVDISGYAAQSQKILRALKKHGMILTDVGGSWHIAGEPHKGWHDGILNANLFGVLGSMFEAVDTSSLQLAWDSQVTNRPLFDPVYPKKSVPPMPRCPEVVKSPFYTNKKKLKKVQSKNGIYCAASDYSDSNVLSCPKCKKQEYGYCNYFGDKKGIPCAGPKYKHVKTSSPTMTPCKRFDGKKAKCVAVLHCKFEKKKCVAN